MKLLNAVAASLMITSLMAVPAAFATEPMKKLDMHKFMQSCDMDHDGMMSKAEMLKHMEKMFDKYDAKKSGKLDKKQTEQFLKDLTGYGGA